ncbi:Uncharacterised protein [uncultured archaeon]|nr:Uncharacterised protein [uncultured archaeon]
MVSIFPRRFIYSIYERVRNYKTTECLDELRKTQWLSGEELKKFQWSRLENILRHAYKNVPFYRILFDNNAINVENDISIDDFRKIPLLNRQIIDKNRETLLSKLYKPSELTVDMTSGSTGKKLVFYKEKKRFTRSDYLNEAASLRCIEWLEFDRYDKQAFLWGSQMNNTIITRVKNQITNFIFPTLFLSSYNLNPAMMNNYAKKIISFNPKIILGYASALYLFANYLEEKKIKIPEINGVVSSAETLFQFQREKIEKVFQCRVFELYGSREFGTIAQECMAHQGLHISSENIFVEILDEEGNPCKPGKLGKIIITDLDNYCFPFIRYDIGDIGIFSDKGCECGRGLPLLEKVEGRTFDVIVGTNGKYFTGTFWTILFRTYVNGIEQFQVLQENNREIIIKLVVDDSFTENEKKKLLKVIHGKCGEDMTIVIQLMDTIPLTGSGKHRFVISKISPFLTHYQQEDAIL